VTEIAHQPSPPARAHSLTFIPAAAAFTSLAISATAIGGRWCKCAPPAGVGREIAFGSVRNHDPIGGRE
jgi:hypothetical protein